MPFRRRSNKSVKASRAISAACEHLENRTLLTAVVNGLFTGTNTIYDGTNTFIYRQANGDDNIKISVTGNITAEFIGARAPLSFDELLDNPNGVVLTDLLPDTAPAFVAPTATTPAQFPSTFLFSIYIVSADVNSGISIAQVANRTNANPQPARPMQPFSGGQPMNNVFNATTGALINVTPAAGGVYIGAQNPTANIANTPQLGTDVLGRPLIFSDQSAFGMRPSNAGQLYAGIETAGNVDIGKILIGGAVTGIVDIGGDVDTFYAGAVLTGDAAGVSVTVSQEDQSNVNLGIFPTNNFHIGGDIRNLLTAGSFGTISMTAVSTANDFTTPNYSTAFQLDVGGKVGFMYAADSFLGQSVVRNGASITGTGIAQREIEYIAPALADSATLFDVSFLGNDATIGAASMDARFLNDTYDSAQFLGSFRSVDLGLNDVMQVKGSLTNVSGLADNLDFYAVSLLAGQYIDVQLNDGLGSNSTSAHARLGIMDPRGRLIATDYSNLGEYARVNKAIRIKASIPGTYRIVIARNGDFNFNGTREAGVEFNQTFTNARPYELRVTNVGNMGMGALVANQHIGTLDINGKGIQVLRGDLGAVRAGMGPTVDGRAVTPAQGSGQIVSFSNPWYIPAGHFRTLEAFSLGNSGAIVVLGSGPDLQVRKGSIGFIRTTGTALTNTMQINDTHFTISNGAALFPSADGDLSLTPGYLAAGMDIQVVDCAGVFEGTLLANRAIGTIRTQQLGGILISATASTITILPNDDYSDPVIQVNVDTIGSDGVVDLIDVTLNTAGTTSVYYPALSTGPNGNIRYFHVGANATVRWDRNFGGGTLGAPRQLAPGEEYVDFDDSGAKVVLTPIPRVKNTLFPRPVSALSDYLDPPTLAVLSYPVRGKSGRVIMRVLVTQADDPFSDGATNINRPGGGGMQAVATSTNGAKTSVEIAEINVSTTAGASTSNPMTFNPFTTATGGITADVLAQPRSYVRTAPPDDPTLVIRPLDLIFQGNTTVDIYEIIGTAAQTINSIDNQTNGEILNVSGGAATVGPDIVDFTAQSIGVGKSSTGALVEGGVQRVVDTFPFTDIRNMINVSDLASLRARGAVGNVQATNIGVIVADSDNKNTSGTFEGIVGVIASRGTGNQVLGNIVQVDVGQGLLSSGTGGVVAAAAGGAGAVRGFIAAGIFADGIIDSVVGNGDIRGDIVATANTTYTQQQAQDAAGNALINPDGTPLNINTPRFAIGGVRITGSIVDADILTTPLNQSVEAYGAGSVQYSVTARTFIPAESVTSPDFDIANIRVDGGGIIGSFIFAQDIGPVTVTRGYGVFTTSIATTAQGVFQGITTDGLGIRGVLINSGDVMNSQSGGSVRNLIASGTGARVATTSYSATVRQSETSKFDAYSGQGLDIYNDIHQYLGTSTRRPSVVGTSETGLIVDTQAAGPGDLGKVEAFRILGKNVITTNSSGQRVRIPAGSLAYPMRLNFANSIGSVLVKDVVDGLSLTTGKLNTFSAGNDVSYTALNVGTSLKSFYAGAFRGTSSLKMTTVAGTLENFRTRRSLYGTVIVSQDILNMTVGTDIGSPLIRVSRNLKNLNVAGSTLTGSSLTVGKTLSNLVIGKDVQQGSTIRASVISKQKIGGQVLGDIIIT